MKIPRKVICWGSKCRQNKACASKITESRSSGKLSRADRERARSDLRDPGRVPEDRLHKGKWTKVDPPKASDAEKAIIGA